jgi:signal transduction histidine kinase/Tfp pilus assembly protein PilF
MMICIVFVGVVGYQRIAYTQQLSYITNSDSLLEELQKHKELDTNYINTHYLYARSLFLRDMTDASMLSARRTLDLSNKLKYKQGVAKALFLIAQDFKVQGNFDSAMSCWQKSLEISETINLKTNLVDVYNNLGGIAQIRSNPQEAFSFFFKAREYSLQCNQYKLGNVLYNIGLVYTDLNDDRKALEYFQQSVKSGDTYGRLNSLKSIGVCCKKLKEYDRALDYLQQALDLAKLAGFKTDASQVLNNMAGVYREKGDYKESLYYCNEALNISNSVGAKVLQAEQLMELGSIYRSMGDLERARNYYERSKEMYQALGNKKELADSYHHLAYLALMRHDSKSAFNDVYEGLRLAKACGSQSSLQQGREMLIRLYYNRHDYKNAFLHQDTLLKLKERIFDTDIGRELIKLEATFSNERREGEVELLKSRNEMASLQLAQQNFRQKILMGFLVIVIAIIVSIYVNLRIKIEAHKKLKEQNSIIELQRQELVVSLENLKLAQEKLIQSEKLISLGRITSGIAHEIKNPLNYISGGVEALLAVYQNLTTSVKCTPQKVESIREAEMEMNDLMHTIVTGVQKISRIIESLRLFSSPQKQEFTSVDLHHTLDSALTILGSKIRYADIKLEKRYAQHSLFVQGDATALSQVFLNIIDNAVFAVNQNQGDKQITVSTEEKANRILIVISDNGPGIPLEIQSKIMDPFYTTKDVGQGTGLGLSISQSIITHHNGVLNVISNPGEGAHFLISFSKETCL